MIIEFLGIDGSGKTTQIHKLMRWANESGVPCYERIIRSMFRRVLGGIAAEKGFLSWHELFDPNSVELATALEMLQVVYSTILPANLSGQLLVTDTYIGSFLATAIAAETPLIDQLMLIYKQIPAPDISIYLDVSVAIAYQRILLRKKGDHKLIFGDKAVEKLRMLDIAFREFIQCSNYPIHIVSTSISEEETFKEIKQLVLAQVSSSAPQLSGLLSNCLPPN
ncbi:MAG: nucleoside/nucleotide kinase family protein [Nostoc sp.]